MSGYHFSTHTTHPSHVCLLEQQLPLSFVCFDFEWDPIPDIKGNQPFRAASFVDTNGVNKVFLIQDYENTFGVKAEYALLLEVINHLNKYQCSFGWYSKGFEFYNEEKKRTEGRNSDLVILDKRLKSNGIPSIVGFNRLGVPYIRGSNHIDALKLYEKPMVKVSIYKNKYTGLSLDMVSKAIIGKGKYKGYSGRNFDSLPTIEDKRNYVLEDSQLVFEILRYNNYEILKLMLAISNLTGVSFEAVCNGGVSKLWTRVLDDAVSKELENLRLKENNSSSSPRHLLLQNYYNREAYQPKSQTFTFKEENEVYPIVGQDSDEREEGEDDNQTL